jgi:hypothetical protein
MTPQPLSNFARDAIGKYLAQITAEIRSGRLIGSELLAAQQDRVSLVFRLVADDQAQGRVQQEATCP